MPAPVPVAQKSPTIASDSRQMRMRLKATPAGERVLAKRKRLRTKAVVAYFPRQAQLELLMRSARL